MKSFKKIDKDNYLKIGIILIITGILFGLDKILGTEIFHKLWPILTLILGAGSIGIFRSTKIRSTLYLITGELLILFSFLAFFCNFYSWSILVHTWPIFITFTGIILFTVYLTNRSKEGLLLLSIFLSLISVYFYLYINFNNSFWWTLLIIGGVSLIVIRKNNE